MTLTNEGTRDVRVATTGDGGDYVFNLLPIGSYTVAVALQGFGSQSTKVALSAGDRVRFDTKLQVGLVAETITVTAASPLLQTDTVDAVGAGHREGGAGSAGERPQFRAPRPAGAGCQ